MNKSKEKCKKKTIAKTGKKKTKVKRSVVKEWRVPKRLDKLTYYTPRLINWKESFAEARIRTALSFYDIDFYQEISFEGFGHSFSPFRFDFYLPKYAVIIEYDGFHHTKKHVVQNDLIKNEFCRLNRIKVFRFNLNHFSNLEVHIVNLMTSLSIKIK